MTYYAFIQYVKNAKSNGVAGEATEMAVRSWISGRLVKKIKMQNEADAIVTFKKADGKRGKIALEVKTACGRVDNIMRNAYVAYWAEPFDDVDVEDAVVVFTPEEWKAFMTGYNGRGKFLNVRDDGQVHIQSFRGILSGARPKASLPIANYINEACENQPTLREFITELRSRA